MYNVNKYVATNFDIRISVWCCNRVIASSCHESQKHRPRWYLQQDKGSPSCCTVRPLNFRLQYHIECTRGFLKIHFTHFVIIAYNTPKSDKV